MEKQYILKMGKQKLSKGFTLIETILVLYILSLLLFLSIPHINAEYNLKYSMQIIKNVLLSSKYDALINKQDKIVTINKNKVYTSEQTFNLNNVYCDEYTVRFNKRGNVDKGGNITCSCLNKSKQLIIHLGSGDFEIR